MPANPASARVRICKCKEAKLDWQIGPGWTSQAEPVDHGATNRTVNGSTRAQLRASCCGMSLVQLDGAIKPVTTRSEATWDGTAWPKRRNLSFLMTQGRSKHSNKAEEQPVKEMTYNQGLKIHE